MPITPQNAAAAELMEAVAGDDDAVNLYLASVEAADFKGAIKALTTQYQQMPPGREKWHAMLDQAMTETAEGASFLPAFASLILNDLAGVQQHARYFGDLERGRWHKLGSGEERISAKKLIAYQTGFDWQPRKLNDGLVVLWPHANKTPLVYTEEA